MCPGHVFATFTRELLIGVQAMCVVCTKGPVCNSESVLGAQACRVKH